LFLANHDDAKFPLGNQLIDVKRGEVVTSEIKLMERWGWSRTKVRDYLSLLVQEKMILKKSDSKKTTLNVVNYDTWQDSPTTEEQQKNSKKTAKKHNQECKECKEDIKLHSPDEKTPSGYKELIAYFFQVYEETYKAKYMFNKTLDGEATKRLLKTYGFDGAKERVDIYFDYTDDYIQQNGRSIHALGSNITTSKLDAHKKKMEYYRGQN